MSAEPQRLDPSAGESFSPDGVGYRIPTDEEAESTFHNIAERAEAHRRHGGQIVVVQGLGFVGSAVAAAVSSVSDEDGRPLNYVIGVDLATPASYWKVGKINDGEPPFRSPDAKLPPLFREGVQDRENLRATTCEAAYELADVIIVDVHLDVEDRVVEGADEIRVDLASFEAAIHTVGRNMRADALVLVETTVPMGACERIVLPILREERLRRGIEQPVLLANAYERVMPGPGYVESILAYRRTFAGVDEPSAERARAFLSTVIDVEGHPLWELADTVSSELGKLLENSYRASNIAFMHEWTLLAEKIGINLFEVVDSIRVRSGTHDNMRYPGFGVGGYCLTKDSLLAQWSATNLFGVDTQLGMTLAGLKTNYEMPLHTLELAEEVAGGDLAGKTIAVCGVSYLADVADTRNSPTETLVDGLLEKGARVRVHDPHVVTWIERPEIEVLRTLAEALDEADGVVLAVPHDTYVSLAAEDLVALVDRSAFVVDAQNVLTDAKAQLLHDAGRRVIGVGKGHWRTKRYDLEQ
jgi:UDP-N-acetyl-D-glucosamine dehydrogenase